MISIILLTGEGHQFTIRQTMSHGFRTSGRAHNAWSRLDTIIAPAELTQSEPPANPMEHLRRSDSVTPPHNQRITIFRLPEDKVEKRNGFLNAGALRRWIRHPRTTREAEDRVRMSSD